MHTDPILTLRLAQLITDERRAEAVHERQLHQARTGRPRDLRTRSVRRIAGESLIRLGSRVEGAPVRRPVTGNA